MLAMLIGVQQPLLAKKNEHSSSSRRSKKSCCKKTLHRLKTIEETTQNDLQVDYNILGLTQQINQTTKTDLTIDREILDIVSCGDPMHITQKMVGTQGLLIDQEGVYGLCEDISFSPPAPSGLTAASSQVQMDASAIEAAVRDVFHAGRKTSPSISEVAQAIQQAQPSAFVVKKNSATSKNALAVQGRPAAITIGASNVYLNLNNFTLSQGNSTPDVVGIEILPGVDNVTIVNGTITTFLGSGIHSFVDVSDPEAIQKVSNITLSNLNVVHNGGNGNETLGTAPGTGIVFENGILPNAFTDVYDDFLEFPAFENVRIDNCRVNDNTLVGIYFTATRGVTIQDSECNGTFINGNSPSGFIFGMAALQLTQCDDVHLRNSSFDNTNHNDLNAFMIFCVGLEFGFVKNITVESCTFNHTEGNSVWVNAVLGGNNAGVFLNNSQFNSCRGFANTGNIGFHISDGHLCKVPSQGYLVTNCQFDNHIMETNSNSFDFIVLGGTDWLTFKDVVYDTCQSSGHKYVHTGALPSYSFEWITGGFSVVCSSGDPVSADIASLRSVRWKNCSIGDLYGIRSVFGIQFGAFGTASGNNGLAQTAFGGSIEDCNISYLRTDDPKARLTGILLAADPSTGDGAAVCQDVQVKNCRVVNLQRSVESQDNISTAGILAQGIQRPVIFGNNVANCINGILLRSGSTKGVISGNEVSSCSNTGYSDLTGTTSSLWMKNVAFANGSNAASDYAITWGGPAPVVAGTLSSYPSTSQQWYNISVQP